MILVRTYGVGAEQNERKTLTRKVNISELAEQIRDKIIKNTLLRYSHFEDLHFWDFGVRSSEHIKAGDIVYIMISGRYKKKLYHGHIIYKFLDIRGEIGDALGWHRLHAQPWTNPVLINDLVELKGLYDALETYLEDKIYIETNLYKIHYT